MKRTIALLSSLIMVLSLCACGGESTDSNTNASKDGSVYKLGDTIETDLFKITPSFTGYAKRLSNQPNEDYMTPAGYFTDDSPYIAGDEKVEIYGEMKIEYVGNEKSTVPLKIDISADYDNGYVFDGDAVYMGYREADDESWHWKYDDTIEFEPLSSSTTRILRYCVEVPEQVETNADKALLVTISVNDEPFVFDFRSADVLGSDYPHNHEGVVGELLLPQDGGSFQHRGLVRLEEVLGVFLVPGVLKVGEDALPGVPQGRVCREGDDALVKANGEGRLV